MSIRRLIERSLVLAVLVDDLLLVGDEPLQRLHALATKMVEALAVPVPQRPERVNFGTAAERLLEQILQHGAERGVRRSPRSGVVQTDQPHELRLVAFAPQRERFHLLAEQTNGGQDAREPLIVCDVQVLDTRWHVPPDQRVQSLHELLIGERAVGGEVLQHVWVLLRVQEKPLPLHKHDLGDNRLPRGGDEGRERRQRPKEGYPIPLRPPHVRLSHQPDGDVNVLPKSLEVR